MEMYQFLKKMHAGSVPNNVIPSKLIEENKE